MRVFKTAGWKTGGLFFVFAVLMLSAGNQRGWAAEDLSVPALTPVPEVQVETLLMRKPGIPGARYGYIERLEEGLMVINDVLFKITAETRYYQRYNGVPASASEFPVGTHVGYLHENGRDINILWMAE